MSGPRRIPDWFERHDAEIRELAWLGAVAGAVHPSLLGAEEVREAAPPLPDAEPAPAPPVSADREALELAERTLAGAKAELEATRAELAAAHAETSLVRAELDAARVATARFAATMRDDAEVELVKLAMSVAERVVARELSIAPELVVDWAREAIAGSDVGDDFVVAMSDDLSSSIPEGGWKELESSLRKDPALPSATCEVRDGGRVITVSADARLDLIEEHLAPGRERKAA